MGSIERLAAYLIVKHGKYDALLEFITAIKTDPTKKDDILKMILKPDSNASAGAGAGAEDGKPAVLAPPSGPEGKPNAALASASDAKEVGNKAPAALASAAPAADAKEVGNKASAAPAADAKEVGNKAPAEEKSLLGGAIKPAGEGNHAPADAKGLKEAAGGTNNADAKALKEAEGGTNNADAKGLKSAADAKGLKEAGAGNNAPAAGGNNAEVNIELVKGVEDTLQAVEIVELLVNVLEIIKRK